MLVAAAAAVLAVALWSSGAAAQAGGAVWVAQVRGPITPVLADHVADAVEAAALDDAAALVLQMDTPGGLDLAMRDIVQAVLAAPIPVIVHVDPPGARAASAGAIIALSSNVIAMAPGTNIGAATPVDLQAGAVLDKVVNDAVAYVQALAEHRGRDAAFYVDAVRDGRSASATEALDIGAIDVIADGTAELLQTVHGMRVQVSGRGALTLDVADAAVTPFDLSGVRGLLQRIADPNIAFLLLSLGGLAIVYEVANPGGGFGGAVGAVMLVMGFFALSVLPVNVAGVLLLMVAAALFIAEAAAPGIGAFAGGGALALLVAGLLLFQRPTGVAVSLAVVVPAAVLIGAAVAVLGVVAVRTRDAPESVGAAGSMVGALGVVREVLDDGTLYVLSEGTRWRAVATRPMTVGQHVRVVAIDGLTVTVEPVVQQVPG